MSYVERSGPCLRSEYEEAYSERLSEHELKVGQLGVIYFEIYQDKEYAVRQLIRIANLDSLKASAVMKMDLQFLDDDLQPMEGMQGSMADGVWNNYSYRLGRKSMIKGTVMGKQASFANGCIKEYQDGIENELHALTMQDLSMSSV